MILGAVWGPHIMEIIISGVFLKVWCVCVHSIYVYDCVCICRVP